MYEINDIETHSGIEQVITYINNGVSYFIPLDEANADYQAYLAWKAEQ